MKETSRSRILTHQEIGRMQSHSVEKKGTRVIKAMPVSKVRRGRLEQPGRRDRRDHKVRLENRDRRANKVRLESKARRQFLLRD